MRYNNYIIIKAEILDEYCNQKMKRNDNIELAEKLVAFEKEHPEEKRFVNKGMTEVSPADERQVRKYLIIARKAIEDVKEALKANKISVNIVAHLSALPEEKQLLGIQWIDIG
jgi:hypothetical protein